MATKNDCGLTEEEIMRLAEYRVAINSCMDHGDYSFMYYWAQRIQEVLKPYVTKLPHPPKDLG